MIKKYTIITLGALLVSPQIYGMSCLGRWVAPVAVATTTAYSGYVTKPTLCEAKYENIHDVFRRCSAHSIEAYNETCGKHLEEFIKNGADINAIDKNDPFQETALHIAVAHRDVMTVLWLVQHKANLYKVDRFDRRPLKLAMEIAKHCKVDCRRPELSEIMAILIKAEVNPAS